MREIHPAARKIEELGVVLVVRAEKADEAMMKGIRAVVEGGVVAVEITFTVPDAVSVIDKINSEFGDEVLLGAGTVLTPSDAEAAAGAGARYIVSPTTNIEVMGISKRLASPRYRAPSRRQRSWRRGARARTL